MLVRRLLAAAGFLLAVAGCGAHTVAPVPTTPLSSLTVMPAADTLHVGDRTLFSVVAVDTNGATVSNPVLAWSSSNPNVFRVSNTGSVTAVAEGAATLSVSSGGRTATAQILVLPTQRGWFSQPSNVLEDLRAVFFTADGNDGWAVGTAGKIIGTANAGATWTTQASSVSNTLNSVWFTSATEGWVAGNGGRILRTTNRGAGWALVPSGTTDNLNGITFATPDTGWAVGVNGTILRTVNRGATWTRSTNVTSVILRGVSFAGTRDGWAVGDNGIILGTHDRGLTWFIVQPAITSLTLYGVTRPTVSSAHAAGTGGAIPRTIVTPDSVAWENRNVGVSNDLRAVTFIDEQNGWAAGRNGLGLILVTTDGGVTWNAQVTATSYLLSGIRFIDGLRGWAVGDNGTVLHTVTGGGP